MQSASCYTCYILLVKISSYAFHIWLMLLSKESEKVLKRALMRELSSRCLRSSQRDRKLLVALGDEAWMPDYAPVISRKVYIHAPAKLISQRRLYRDVFGHFSIDLLKVMISASEERQCLVTPPQKMSKTLMVVWYFRREMRFDIIWVHWLVQAV